MNKAMLAAVLLLFSSTVNAVAQKATKITLTFNTTSDDKDWNTEMRASFVCNGLVVAQLNCCNQNHDMDHWDNNSTTSRDILSPQPFAKGSLAGCTYILGIVAVGNDTWAVIPTVDVYYDDGSHTTQTFNQTVLTSSSSNLYSKSFPLQ
jgi:hypothetical protein